MKDAGVELVVYVGPYQNTVKLQQAMEQQGFDPEVFLQDATIYDDDYVEQAGSLGDGTFVYSSTDLFDDMQNKEMALYRSWLDQVSPGAVPNYYGLYAWSAARLFVAAGGQARRQARPGLDGRRARRASRTGPATASTCPSRSAPSTTYNCVSIIQLNGGKWSQVSGNELPVRPAHPRRVG